jgi:hypothetical protein
MNAPCRQVQSPFSWTPHDTHPMKHWQWQQSARTLYNPSNTVRISNKHTWVKFIPVHYKSSGCIENPLAKFTSAALAHAHQIMVIG